MCERMRLFTDTPPAPATEPVRVVFPRTIDGIETDNLDIRRLATVTVNGVLRGDIAVRAEAGLIVNGLVHGNVTVEDGGHATINGTVSGIVASDGHVRVTGDIGRIDEQRVTGLELTDDATVLNQ